MSAVVLVAGPPSAGVTSTVGELQRRLPGWRFVETGDIGVGADPVAVVFVMSAVAPVTESDCALADLVTANTDAVVAVVSKVDDHRDWRGVLAENRERLAGRVPRFGSVPWIGAAAAPRLGEPLVDDLVELLQRELADPSLAQRNNLRAREFRVRSAISHLDAEAADRRSRAAALLDTREQLLRQRRLSLSEGTAVLRNQMQQARVELTYSARNRCAKARTDLQKQVVAADRGRFDALEREVRRRCDDVIADVADEVTARTREMADALGLDALPQSAPARPMSLEVPPLKSRGLETRLMTVLGAGFGLGVALLVSRMFAGLAPDAALAGSAVGAAIGVAVTVWVVTSRGVLHDRAVLDRWVGEATSAVRAAVEEQVAIGVLAAEAALTSAHLARVEAEGMRSGRRIAEIDAELRDLAREIARAEAAREREMPGLQRALETIHSALTGESATDSVVTGR